MLLRALEVQSEYTRGVTYGRLGILHHARGDREAAEKYFLKARAHFATEYNPKTRRNYLALERILERRGIPLVAVQYPLRSVDTLKRMLASPPDVRFVDNEDLFRQALATARYDEIFSDHFGGDFGHMTPRGNRLLAENVATTILQEVPSGSVPSGRTQSGDGPR